MNTITKLCHKNIAMIKQPSIYKMFNAHNIMSDQLKLFIFEGAL